MRQKLTKYLYPTEINQWVNLKDNKMPEEIITKVIEYAQEKGHIRHDIKAKELAQNWQ